MSKHDPFCGDDGCRGECVREAEERALEAAVVEAAMAWVKHGEILPGLAGSTISNLFDACAALRAFREKNK